MDTHETNETHETSAPPRRYLVCVAVPLQQPRLAHAETYADLFDVLAPFELELEVLVNERGGMVDGTGMGAGARDILIYTDHDTDVEGYLRLAERHRLVVSTVTRPAAEHMYADMDGPLAGYSPN